MKTRERVKKYGEVFTPPDLVGEMLGELPKETWQEGKTFLDPACGDGNFLVAILAHKLRKGHNPLIALQTTYGVDIMRDNIQECRCRLLDTLVAFGVEITKDHCRAVLQNIKWLNTKVYPKGSLDYDFGFEDKPKRGEVNKWFDRFRKSRKVA